MCQFHIHVLIKLLLLMNFDRMARFPFLHFDNYSLGVVKTHGCMPSKRCEKFRGGSRIFGSGFKLAEGFRLVQFDQFFLKFPNENQII